MRFAAPLILGLLLSCGGRPASRDGFASTEIFYFEVVCTHPAANCQEAKRFLEAEIPRYKYTFTPGSSRSWPYYKAFDLDAEVPQDSLIPPHTRLHQLVPRNDRPMFGGGNHLVLIELFTVADTIPDYAVTIYKLESSGPSLVGASGLHNAKDQHEDLLSVPEIILKSVIRYSFK